VVDILIVEDSPITAHLEARSLSQAGYSCRTVDSGNKALDLIRKQPPLMILLDYVLPDLDGLQVLRAILADNPDAVVVVVTGQGDERLAAEMMKAGARDYVLKTEHFYEPLVHVVDQVLREDKIRRALGEKERRNERLQAQNEVCFWMAHHFRNLFSGAMGFLQLIDFEQEDQPAEKRISYQKHALACLGRAAELLDQLLNLTEREFRASAPVQLGELLHQSMAAVIEHLNLIGQHAGTVEFLDSTGPLATIGLYHKDARVVLENILKNAIEALDGTPGKITVGASLKEGDVLELKVTDTGRGMDENVRSKALEPLFSTKGTVGAGLGLSLVLAVLRRHGGDLMLESIPGRGTTVTITWPLHPGPVEEIDVLPG